MSSSFSAESTSRISSDLFAARIRLHLGFLNCGRLQLPQPEPIIMIHIPIDRVEYLHARLCAEARKYKTDICTRCFKLPSAKLAKLPSPSKCSDNSGVCACEQIAPRKRRLPPSVRRTYAIRETLSTHTLFNISQRSEAAVNGDPLKRDPL